MRGDNPLSTAEEPLNSDTPLRQAERGEATGRLIIPAHPTVLLGRHQDASAADVQEAARLGWDVRRRLTPGGAVYLDSSAVCVEVALPASHPAATPDVIRATEWFGKLLASALRTLGARAVVAGTAGQPVTGLAAEACFASWVRGELLLDGRKVFGTAQYRRRRDALFQGVALTAGSHGRVAAVLSGSPRLRHKAAVAIDSRSTVLTGMTVDAIRDAIRAVLEGSSVPVREPPVVDVGI